jgi:endonuclease/exonuclease/phosphatase family metal-dependent hydrolase
MKTTITNDFQYNASGVWLRARKSRDPLSHLAEPGSESSLCKSYIHRAGAVLLLVLITLFGLPVGGHAQRADVGGKRDLTVMTRNLYVGANFGSIVAASDFVGLVTAVTEVYYTVVAQNNFQLRVAGIADEIVAMRPDLVGLQEVSTVRLQSPGDLLAGGSPASFVVIDYLQVLLKALADRGAHYAAVSIVTNADVELPIWNSTFDGLDDARLTDHDVILARTDLPPGYLRLSHPEHGNFQSSLVIPVLGGELEFKRGWCSVDAFVRGRTFRFITTHLEEETSPTIQLAQAKEILAGPASGDMPVILVGDTNTDGNRQNGTLTYDYLLHAGFKDSWSALYPRSLGLTWGHDPLLADPSLAFVWRIDLILFDGGNFVPMEASVLDRPLHRSTPPFWSSDHAGVVARFLLK